MCLVFGVEESERTAEVKRKYKGQYFFAEKKVRLVHGKIITPYMKEKLNYPYHVDRRRGGFEIFYVSFSHPTCLYEFHGGGIHVYQPPPHLQQFYPSPSVMWEDISVTIEVECLYNSPIFTTVTTPVIVAVDDLIMIGDSGDLVVAAIEFPPDLFEVVAELTDYNPL